MGQDLPLFPDQASTLASRVDQLYFFLISVTAFASSLSESTSDIKAICSRKSRSFSCARPARYGW